MRRALPAVRLSAIRLLATGLAALLAAAPLAAKVRVNGSTTVNPVVVEAAALLARDGGLEVQVDTLGGSSGGLAALGEGRAEVAMSSRPLLASDRERYPLVAFHPIGIGLDALALVVSRDVWRAGVRSLSRGEVRKLYEGEISNWRRLGGPDRRVAFFNKEPGRGTWEVFAAWAYDDSSLAPLVALPEVGSNEEARNKVGSTRGAITQLSAAWADGEHAFALALRLEDGRTVTPDAETARRGTYPLARPLLVVTDGPPRGETKRLVDFLLGPRGQALVERHGYLALPATEIDAVANTAPRRTRGR